METTLTATTGTPTTYAVTGNWLDCDSGGVSTTNCIGPYYGNAYYYYYPWVYPIYNQGVTVARPIKLKMSEVERLRRAAKADKALKSILEKFTEQIEITVDFD